MAAIIQPLASTLRVLEWDDLPASVRTISDNFNPLADGILMLHQRQVAALKASIIAIPKGRRTGITFGTMLDKTLVAAARKSAGGDNVYYIGDTKEKGLEAIGYCAKFARVIARAQGEGVSGVEEFLFEDQDEGGKTKHITAYRIRFASGFQVCALSSRPANIRGLQGHVVIDEAAFHPDVQGVLDAATALLIWGGQITIISSHNGKNNPFAQLCRDIEAGRYGADAAVVTVTFDDAVTNGLYERVCFMKGTPATAEGKKEWYSKIRNAYGVRKAAMREELDAIPRDGSGVSLPGVWIENAMAEERLRRAWRLTMTSCVRARRNAAHSSRTGFAARLNPPWHCSIPNCKAFSPRTSRATATSRCSVLGRSWRTCAGAWRSSSRCTRCPRANRSRSSGTSSSTCRAVAAAPWMQQVRARPWPNTLQTSSGTITSTRSS
ncbi:hypothetical protein WJ970_24385 [Achromobacter xylosoxidans]